MALQSLALVAYCALLPAVVLALERRFAWARALGAVLICCGLGIAVANQPFFTVDPALAEKLKKATDLINSITIPLAIPLLLFQSDMSDLKSQGKSALTAFGISVLSVFVGITTMRYAFGDMLGAEGGKSAGMLMSVYIGGTPNLVAVQTAVQASEDTFGVVFAASTFVSTFYLFFVLSVAKPLLGKVFPAHPLATASDDALLQDEAARLPWSRRLSFGGLSLLGSIVCVAIAAGSTILLFGKIQPLGVILGITTLAIAGSFFKPLREIPTHEPIGTYLILAFCISAGTMMDIGKLMASGSVFLTFTVASMALFLTIHYALNRLVGNDIDTTITMSMATMFGPPFIPAVTKALRNDALLVPGMTLGFLGYAVGTYLGIAAGSFL